jgi:hypothetical protein
VPLLVTVLLLLTPIATVPLSWTVAPGCTLTVRLLTPAPAWKPVGALPVQLTVWPLAADAEFGWQSARAGEAPSSVTNVASANVANNAPAKAGTARRRPPDRPVPMVTRITQPIIQRIQ